MNRRWLLVGSDLARAALVGLFPFVTSIWEVYALVFVVNALTAIFTPAYEATLPTVAGPEFYVQAASLSRVATDVENVVAPSLAALLVGFLSARWLFWFDAASYLASAGLVLSVQLPATTRAPPTAARGGLLAELTRGTRILFGEPSLRQALILSAAEATAGAMVIVLTVVMVRSVFGGSDGTAALGLVAAGLGSAAAATLLNRRIARREAGTQAGEQLHLLRHHWTQRAMFAGGALLTVSLLPGMWIPSLAAMMGLWALNGAGQALIAVSSATLLAEHTTDAERGKAYAAYFAWTHAFWLVAYPFVGHAAARWGPRMTLSLGGVVCLAMLVTAWLAPGRSQHGDLEGAEQHSQ